MLPHSMSLQQFREQAHRVADFVADYYRDLQLHPDRFPSKCQEQPGFLRELLPDHAPEVGESFEVILQDMQQHIMRGLSHWQSPNFFAFFPCNSSYPGMLGEWLSSCFNAVGFTWATSPSFTELETIVMDWLAQAIGLPSSFLSHGEGGGVIQGTASEACLVALLAARQRAVTHFAETTSPEDKARTIGRMVVYTSAQAHSSIKKACVIAGVERLRLIPTKDHAMCTATLETLIQEDVAADLIPLLVVGTYGTTSCGGVDDIAELCRLCSLSCLKLPMWMHVDAAYAGSALLCPEYQEDMPDLGRVDSFNFNPHKWMMTNFDVSALWVRHRSLLVDALSTTPPYLRHDFTGLVTDYKDWQIPLGRRFRALKLWFVLRSFGLEGLRHHIRKDVELARRFESFVRKDDRFELIAPAKFGLVCFRWRNHSDRDNEVLLNAINEGGKYWLINTKEDDQFIIRFATGSPQTLPCHVDAAWEHIQQCVSRLEEGGCAAESN